jgi:RHS repeat-associated protein
MIYTPYGSIRYRMAAHDTPFLFGGFFGIATDRNGLVHMRARYYNPLTLRFLNSDPAQDGWNWYAYANGNPMSYADPTGYGASSTLNALQTGLSMLGFVPYVGAVADVVNAGIYAARGDYIGAGFSLAAAVPGIGDFAAAGRAVHSVAQVSRFTHTAAPIISAARVEVSVARGATQLEFSFAKQLDQTSGLVIGRGADLAKPGALAVGEYKLGWMSVQKTSGMEAEWAINQGKLQNAMNLNKPIRDASPLSDIDGFYLNRERGFLQSSGWNYQNGYWLPPKP